MAKTRLELTWDKRSKRWKKVYRGQQHYFPFGDSKADKEGYKLALAAWYEKRAEIDSEGVWNKPNGDQYRHAIEIRQAIIQWFESQGEFDQAAKHRAEIEQLRKQYNLRRSPAVLVGYDQDPLYDDTFLLTAIADIDIEQIELTGDPGGIAMSIWEDRLSSVGTLTKPAESIGTAIGEYMAQMRAKARRGEISHGWAINLESRFKHVDAFCGSQPIESVNAKTLSLFHSYLQGKVDEKTWSGDYASGLLKTFTTLLKWLWQNEQIETLPRNIDKVSIAKGNHKLVLFTVEELTLLLNHATGRTKLFLLLMMNCGYTQQDISDLKLSEIDWQKGTITRQRSKTEGNENVPTVTYTLWPETLRLLKEFRSDDDKERVLLNANGSPLRFREYRESGTGINLDNIKNAYDRLCRVKAVKADIPSPKPLKSIRKTSASMLEQHEVYGRYAQYFLGQAPDSVAAKHYVVPSQDLFNKAVHWLGTQYGLIDTK